MMNNAQIKQKGFVKSLKSVIRHLVLAFLALFWLIPIIWLVGNSFGIEKGVNFSHFFPEKLTITNYKQLFTPDTIVNFPRWFTNTLIIAIFTCIISSMFVLMVSYAMSCMRFGGRKALMNVGIILGMFPGFLSMIAVYFVLKSLSLTNTHIGLILVYSGASGLGYLIAKGYFDTIPKSLNEAAKIEGASEAVVFWKVALPLSRPIIVYTVISSFLAPWMDFVMANILLNNGIVENYTVSVGLYKMLLKTLINNYFAQFCAGGILVSIPISILFIIMQRFYVDSIAGGAVKG
jgi:arabinogalactan oligomer/maltooligosaccharide transport system permease protein